MKRLVLWFIILWMIDDLKKNFVTQNYIIGEKNLKPKNVVILVR